MCVITIQRNDRGDIKPLSKNNFDSMWLANPNMGGIMYTLKGENQVYVSKYKTRSDMWEDYKEILNNNKLLNIVLHFRISTSGMSFDNCHPFTIRQRYDNKLKQKVDTIAMCHNGVISGLGDSSMSDTHMLAIFLRGLIISNPKKELPYSKIASFVGSYNKLVFLDCYQSPENQIIICNPGAFTTMVDKSTQSTFEVSNQHWYYKTDEYAKKPSSWVKYYNMKGSEI